MYYHASYFNLHTGGGYYTHRAAEDTRPRIIGPLPRSPGFRGPRCPGHGLDAGISTHAIYSLFEKGELPDRKVARRWLTGRNRVLG